MNIDDRPTDRTQGPIHAFCKKNSNGHNSATRRPIPFMFGSRWGFRGRRIERRHFWLDQIQDGGRRPSWENFKWPNLWNALSDSLYVHRPYFALGLYNI